MQDNPTTHFTVKTSHVTNVLPAEYCILPTMDGSLGIYKKLVYTEKWCFVRPVESQDAGIAVINQMNLQIQNMELLIFGGR